LIFGGIPHELAFTSVRMKVSTKDTKIPEGFSSCFFVTLVGKHIFRRVRGLRERARASKVALPNPQAA
jgi:hypothetical protein